MIEGQQADAQEDMLEGERAAALPELRVSFPEGWCWVWHDFNCFF